MQPASYYGVLSKYVKNNTIVIKLSSDHFLVLVFDQFSFNSIRNIRYTVMDYIEKLTHL